MKKHILYIFLISLAFTSCEDDESSAVAIQSYSPITIDISISDNNVTIDESAISGSAVAYEVTATLPEAQALDYVINFEQNGGTSDADDFKTHNIIIRAGDLSGKSDIEILKNGTVEGNETLSIKAVTFDEIAKLSGDVEFKASIENDFIDDTLLFSTTWSGDYTFQAPGPTDVTLDFCQIDLDVLLFTINGSFVQYLGATGSCVETGSTMQGLPDGAYFVVIDVYSNPLLGFGLNETVPLTVTYSQSNSDSGTFTSNSFSLASPAGLVGIATFTKSGYNYTVTPL
jgi:hypothetical protein